MAQSAPIAPLSLADPADPTKPSPAFLAAVQQVLQQKVRPGIQSDGGDIALVDIDPRRGRVYVQLSGSCSGCAMSQMTLFGFVQRTLMSEVPGIEEVVPV